jgi:hypothetical protein
MRSTLVGMRTGPLTRRRFSLAPRIRSAHTARRGSRAKRVSRRRRCAVEPGHERRLAGRGSEPRRAVCAPFSRLATWREDRVMRMRCTRATSCSPGLPSVWGGLYAVDICARAARTQGGGVSRNSRQKTATRLSVAASEPVARRANARAFSGVVLRTGKPAESFTPRGRRTSLSGDTGLAAATARGQASLRMRRHRQSRPLLNPSPLLC